jgi:hypothetical protein
LVAGKYKMEIGKRPEGGRHAAYIARIPGKTQRYELLERL